MVSFFVDVLYPNNIDARMISSGFMDLYFEALTSCKLHDDVEQVLQYFKARNKRQFILSAMEHDSLLQSLKDYGIAHYFEAAYGINNHLAAGKIERAFQMIEEYKIIFHQI